MNPTNPTPSHSPLVPQGSIPPKTTSRSSQVLLIAATVVFFHVAGFAVVLMQGCQKDAKTAGTTSLETNGTSGLSLPPIGDTNSLYTTTAPTTSTQAPPVVYTPPTGVVAQAAPSFAAPPTNFGGATPGLTEPPTAAPADTTPLSDYKVVANDNLSKIAAKHHVTVKSILNANPNLDPKKLQVGKTIKIPAIPLPSGEATTTAIATAPAPSGSTALAGGTASGKGVYVVRSGDTLVKIARNNGTTVAAIRAANNMKTTRVLVGQKLKIPARAAAAVPTNSTQH